MILSTEFKLFTSPLLSDDHFARGLSYLYRRLSAHGVAYPHFLEHLDSYGQVDSIEPERIARFVRSMQDRYGPERFWSVGIPWDGGHPVECSAIWGTVMETNAYAHKMNLRVNYDEGAEIGTDEMVDMFVHLCGLLLPVYGYVKLVRHPRETWTNNHFPDDGPLRLEWVNCFGEPYLDDVAAFRSKTVPVDIHDAVDGRFGILSVCDDPEDYFTVQNYLRRRTLMRRIGREYFATPPSLIIEAFVPGTCKMKPAKRTLGDILAARSGSK